MPRHYITKVNSHAKAWPVGSVMAKAYVIGTMYAYPTECWQPVEWFGKKDFLPVESSSLSFLILLSEPRFAENHSCSVPGFSRCDSNPRAAPAY